jgi:two-component system phosphate regulon sensor histidine kinase PhoR
MIKKSQGFYQRIFLVNMAILGMLLLLTSFVAQGLFRGYMLEAKYLDLYHQAETIANLFPESVFLSNSVDENAQQIIVILSERTGTRLTLLAKDGRVLADSHHDPSRMENHMNRKEVSSALHGFYGESKKFSATLGQEFLYVAVPIIKKDGQIVGAVRSSVPFQGMDEVFSKFNRVLIYFALGVMLMFGLLFYFLSSKMAKNLKEMSALAEEIADGNFSRELQINSRDEIGSLAKAFNRMTDKLKTHIDQIGTERAKLVAVLNGISDCVVAVDRECRIIVYNPAAVSIFTQLADRSLNKPFLDSIRDNFLYECIMQVINTGLYYHNEINLLQGNTYSLTVAPILNDEGKVVGAVASMRDISEAKALETIKSQFVANVSHELKTPLTSIKGFVETLQDEVKESEPIQRHFLQIIADETENLTAMVNDLLNLSEIESGKITLRFASVNLRQLVGHCGVLLKNSFDKHCISFLNLIPEDFIKIEADSYRLQQMIVNLLDNAAKYAPNGNVEIRALRVDELSIELVVADNGKGIPKADQPRLFERFYRVDKDRARQTGGTGLGLAIVKHIATAHGGNVQIESSEGKGTKVIVRLPISQEKDSP